MKQIIPLKKDILFKSKIGSLSNLNLDHDYKINDDIVNGTVALSGTYKMTEASVVEDDFFYTIPFSIAISDRIKKDTIQIEIEDFKYEIEKDILKVNIELELTCEENETEEVKDDVSDYLDEYFKDENNNLTEEVKEVKTELDVDNEITNITNNVIETNDKYYTYKIYIVRENDTVESICSKYNITYEELKEYNDLNEINIGDKIIIPSFDD
ncbi:MAG: LysM peptidoglycan-binding domain-containing protein [Bacilli bacterium]|nr:LysM peptidoglycan-binding domain-containing protein [Bacilli bacterium]